jgi:hypothetical protein
MRLSDLQKYILLEALMNKGSKFSRSKLTGFYEKKHKDTKESMRIKAVSKSLERLIDKELLVGYGVRTPHKWFIKEIKLTNKGYKTTKKLLGEQQHLPFKQKDKKRKTTAKN